MFEEKPKEDDTRKKVSEDWWGCEELTDMSGMAFRFGLAGNHKKKTLGVFLAGGLP